MGQGAAVIYRVVGTESPIELCAWRGVCLARPGRRLEWAGRPKGRIGYPGSRGVVAAADTGCTPSCADTTGSGHGAACAESTAGEHCIIGSRTRGVPAGRCHGRVERNLFGAG